jgi:UDP-N-acetylmuramate dehydrogenase
MLEFFTLEKDIGPRFRYDEPLAKHLYIKIGGLARYFAEVQTVEEVALAVQSAESAGLPWFAFGGGSNMLVADEGWEGLAIKLVNRDIRIEGTRVTVGAGAPSVLVARKAAEAGLHGFAWAITLPGTIGGAVRGNAGCFGGEMKDAVREVTVVRGDRVLVLTGEECHFAYRQSVFKEAVNKDVIWSVVLELAPGVVAEELAALTEVMAKRKATQPLGTSSAGCMFKNLDQLTGEEVARVNEVALVPEQMLATHRIAAGWIIEQLGAKGWRVGDAQVSDVHGNFVLNQGKATARDVRDLVMKIQQAAREKFGVSLEPEVQFYGF